MKANKMLVGAAVVAALAVLPACGKRFPAGERLLPETYGPPFGDEIARNLPKHPHYPASAERLALVDSAEAKTYRDFDACHAALEAAVREHGAEGRVLKISAVESIGLYESGGTVHEHRCNDYKLTHRSWCVPGEGGGHGEAHKKPGPGCKDSEAGH